jgi:hypothetical protein
MVEEGRSWYSRALLLMLTTTGGLFIYCRETIILDVTTFKKPVTGVPAREMNWLRERVSAVDLIL